MKKEPEVTLDDVDKALVFLTRHCAPKTLADYSRSWRVLPGGRVEENVRNTLQTSDKAEGVKIEESDNVSCDE